MAHSLFSNIARSRPLSWGEGRGVDHRTIEANLTKESRCLAISTRFESVNVSIGTDAKGASLPFFFFPSSSLPFFRVTHRLVSSSNFAYLSALHTSSFEPRHALACARWGSLLPSPMSCLPFNIKDQRKKRKNSSLPPCLVSDSYATRSCSNI